MKTTLTTCAVIAALIAPAFAAEGWTTDFTAAKAQAAENKKDLFLEFTGSDWCPPCMRLNEEVFSKDEFKTGASEHFVLVKLDFPNDRSGQSEELQAQNKLLSERYSIQGFPTVLLADAEGRPFAATGFHPGGPEGYLEHLGELRKRRTERDAAFETADKAEGVEKAKALVAALDAMELENEMITNFYSEVVEQIKANDPDDATGYASQAAIRESMEKFEERLNELAGNGDYDGILTAVDEMLKTEGLKPDDVQRVTLTRALVFAEQGKFDDAIKVVDEAKAISPQSEIAPMLDGFKQQLESARDEPVEDEEP